MWLKVQCLTIGIISCLARAQLELSDEMLNELQKELDYESILMLQNHPTLCEIPLRVASTTPILNFNEYQKFNIKPLFNKRFLALICLDKTGYATYRALFINLDGMRNTPAIFLLNKSINPSAVFKECYRNQMLNVLAIEIGNPQNIYSYRAFPQFKLIVRNSTEISRYFEPQLRNMAGYPIRSMPDNILPRDVIYKDAEGRPQLTGYLVKFLYNFASVLNATVRIHWHRVSLDSPDRTLGRRVLSAVDKGRVLDIPLSIINIGPTVHSETMIASYVTEISKSQLILPIEPDDDFIMLIFAIRFKNSLILISLAMFLLALLLENAQRLERGEGPGFRFVNNLFDTVLRGMVSQTFVLRPSPSCRLKHIYMMLLVFGILTYNIYITQLQLLILDPPRKPPISNYEEMRKQGLKILISPDSEVLVHAVLGHKHMAEFSDVYRMVNSSVYQALRREPNTSYAYHITQTLWPLIQHKFIKQPREGFRLSDDFVLLNFVPFGVPLPRNSIYEEVLNRYILNTHCSGLYALWFQQTFQSLVEIGKMEVLPYKSVTDSYHILRWQDFCLLFIFYSIYNVLAMLIFIAELTLHRWRENRAIMQTYTI